MPMKQLLFLLCAVCVICGLAGCGGQTATQQSTPADTGVATEPAEPAPTVEGIPLPEEENSEHPLITMPESSLPRFPVPDEPLPEIPLPVPVVPEPEIS